MPLVIGGRYGLSSKDFNPSMAKAVFDELRKPEPPNGFTVGIIDDVSHTSLAPDATFRIDADDVVQAVFYGLGADGTVGANKNSVKIIAEDAGLHAQGYFVYDLHKSGAQTISHLRFGPRPIHAPYLIQQASFIGCHQFQFIARHDVLRLAAPGATVLLNAPYGPDEVWDQLPRSMQLRIIGQRLRLFVIDASRVAQEVGLRGRANTVLQTCFFAHLRRAAARPGDRPHQGVDPQELWQQGRGGRAGEFPRGGRDARTAVRGRGAGRSHQPRTTARRRWRSTRRPSCAR